ncbi:hypothetical protein [Bosea minatitlanensis]|uniref:DUF4231 domain-containing protein n=1 Tax=Bosea minatitlanensis TaxID=128782 RepID=A0ABW0EZK8_9HYPH|nr:hypothetical protein [Bosea minatitlanensis]MCT4492741.1 hypothetical protein [Bosea minatitlanensis]
MKLPTSMTDRAALVLIEEARAYVEKHVSRGRHWETARDEFLHANAGRWIAEYGKDCADIAVRGVNALRRADMLTKAGREAEGAHWRSHWTRYIEENGKATWLNRLWVRWFAMPLYGLVAVAGLAMVAPSPSEAAPRRAALAACAEAITTAEKHQRGCWRFNSVERNTYRAYDRADSPRDWEKPRDWE